MNIQFAGLERFMNNNQYNQGDVAMAAGAIDSALRRFNTGLEGRIASTALGYKAEDKAQNILESAGSYAKGKGNLANWINLGSSLIGPAAGALGSAGSVSSAYEGLGGFGPVASGDAYGGFLDATAGTTGMGPLASGDVYGSFLSRR